LRYPFFVIVLVMVDQITKAIFSSRDFFVGFMHFHLVRNYGLSFGLDFGSKVNLVILLIASALIIFFATRQKFNLLSILIAAGASSNIVDRIIFGYVRDFWDIGLGFTFNVADLFIILGLLLLVLIHDSRSEIDKQFVE